VDGPKERQKHHAKKKPRYQRGVSSSQKKVKKVVEKSEKEKKANKAKRKKDQAGEKIPSVRKALKKQIHSRLGRKTLQTGGKTETGGGPGREKKSHEGNSQGPKKRKEENGNLGVNARITSEVALGLRDPKKRVWGRIYWLTRGKKRRSTNDSENACQPPSKEKNKVSIT